MRRTFLRASRICRRSIVATDILGTAASAPSTFTVLSWVNPDSVAAEGIIMQHGGTGAQRVGDFLTFILSGKLRLYRWKTAGLPNIDYAESTLTVSTGSWHFLGFTWDGINSKVIFQVDTSSETIAIAGGVAGYTAAGVTIGADVDVVYPFSSLIGEVLVYSRALTPQEIQNIYLSTKWRYR